MGDQELLQFYTSGGDLNQLNDADLQKLGQLMKVGPAQPTQPPTLGLTPPNERRIEAPSSPGSIGDIPGKEFVKGLGSSLMSALMLAGGLPGVGAGAMPARVLIETLLGGAKGGIDEGTLGGAATGAALSGGMELGGGLLSEAAPWAGNQVGIRMGTPQSMRPGNQTRKYVEAFLNQRKREGFGKGVAVGKEQGSILPKIQQRTIHPEGIRLRLNKEMDQIKSSLPKREIDFEKVRTSQPSKLRDPQKFIGLDAPADTAKAVESSDKAFWEQNKGLLDTINPPGFTTTPTPPSGPPGSLPGNITTPNPTKITFGDAVEIAQRQGKSAKPVFEQNAQGKWVRAQDSPTQQAARERSGLFKDAAVDYAKSQPGGDEVAKRYLETNAALSDQYKIEEIAKKLRRGLAFAGIRGGLGAGAGSGAAYLTGQDPQIGGAIGGIGGLIGGPTNISRVGNFAGRLGEVGPSAVRTTDLLGELESLMSLFTPEKKPVKMREPK